MADNRPSRKCGRKQCRAWAMRQSDPPRCSAHRQDGGKRVGAPALNQNRRTHGFYAAQPAPEAEVDERALKDINDVVLDALDKQSRLSAYIERCLEGEGMALEEMARLLALHGQNASRIGRLLRDQALLGGSLADELLSLLGAALDDLGLELGIEL